MPESPHAAAASAATDVAKVMRDNYVILARLLAARLACVVVLVGVPVAVNRAGAEASFLLTLPLVVAAFVCVLTAYRLWAGVRLTQCRKSCVTTLPSAIPQPGGQKGLALDRVQHRLRGQGVPPR
ncbi:hypothetical protein GCM10023220_42510 [Streptomyces ziwulingensis]|uniref:Uncharacterized protein n=1 Tax=Streptomyces ziwulingensis TaxID=1045501 RepID=A0ABP9CB28_9ACTN